MSIMDRLTRKLGADARKIALERYPELTKYSIERQEKIVEAVDRAMNLYGMPETADNAEMAFRIVASSGELDKINEENAPPPAPQGFKARPKEEEWLRTGPIGEVADYLRAKFPTG